MTSRRNFMLGSLGLGGLAAFGGLPRLAHASGASRLIVYFAYGGWDTTYLFDPKPGSPDVDTADGDWVTHGDLRLWDTGLMPRTHDFFAEWADRIAVINGISVNSLVHEECARRVLTGASKTQADVASVAAAALGPHRPVPYFTLGANARSFGQEAQAATLGIANQLQSLVVPELAWPTAAERFAPSTAQDDAVAAYLSGRANQLGADRGLRGSNATRLADYAESLDRAEQIRQFAPGSFLEDWSLYNSYDSVSHAAAALAEDFSQAVFISDQGFWDTHGGNRQQASLFNDMSGNLSSLFEALTLAGIVDDTMVLVVSEMGRAPLINATAGKDHWPYTSAMVIGPGVRPGVYGSTDDSLRQQRIDLHSGGQSDSGHALQTRDVLATVVELMGLDAAEHYPDAEVIHAAVG